MRYIAEWVVWLYFTKLTLSWTYACTHTASKFSLITHLLSPSVRWLCSTVLAMKRLRVRLTTQKFLGTISIFMWLILHSNISPLPAGNLGAQETTTVRWRSWRRSGGAASVSRLYLCEEKAEDRTLPFISCINAFSSQSPGNESCPLYQARWQGEQWLRKCVFIWVLLLNFIFIFHLHSKQYRNLTSEGK